jgi:hypothetical protein
MIGPNQSHRTHPAQNSINTIIPTAPQLMGCLAIQRMSQMSMPMPANTAAGCSRIPNRMATVIMSKSDIRRM